MQGPGLTPSLEMEVQKLWESSFVEAWSRMLPGGDTLAEGLLIKAPALSRRTG